MTPNDGGPAFPVMAKDMSLRDWFAGQALAGDFASQSSEMGEWVNNTTDEFMAARASFLYKFADAMLAARGGAK